MNKKLLNLLNRELYIFKVLQDNNLIILKDWKRLEEKIKIFNEYINYIEKAENEETIKELLRYDIEKLEIVKTFSGSLSSLKTNARIEALKQIEQFLLSKE